MRKKNYKRKKRGPVQAKKSTYDGIKFASGLEVYMYKALKKAKIKAKYGAMMMEEVEGKDKDLNDFLIDVQEEIMDALLYIQAARACLRDEIEECMINRQKKFNKNLDQLLDEEEEL